MSSCGDTCTHLGILIAGEVTEKQELRNFLMWGLLSCHVRSRNFHVGENEKYLILIVNKKFKIVNGAGWSNSLIIYSLIVWNNPFGVDVPPTEKPGG